MQIRNAYTSLESVKEWYDASQKPFWTLYSGFGKASTLNILQRNESFEDMTAGWELLEKTLKTNGESGGIYTLFVTDKAKSNQGFYAQISLNIWQQHQQPQINGTPTNNGKSDKDIAKEIDAAVQMAMLRRDIADQNAMIQGLQMGSRWEALADRAMDSIQGFLESPTIQKAIARKFFGDDDEPQATQEPQKARVAQAPQQQNHSHQNQEDTDMITQIEEDFLNVLNEYSENDQAKLLAMFLEERAMLEKFAKVKPKPIQKEEENE